MHPLNVKLIRSGIIFARTIFLLLVVATVPSFVYAGAFSVSPVRIYMTPRDRAVAVAIINEGDSEVVLQADINEWTQSADGNDELRLTEDLILAPPMIRLAPQARQVVRLALLKPADPERQMTFRLIVREISEVTAPKNNAVQVPIAFALSMPVFITPAGAKRSVFCDASRNDNKTLVVSCGNTGTAYAQVREILVRSGGQTLARFEGGIYILPGSRKSVSVRTQYALPTALELQARYDDGEMQSFNVNLP